jgi:hypothetical protein
MQFSATAHPPALKPSTPDDDMRNIWGNWHKTTVPLPKYWSHDWTNWSSLAHMFYRDYEDSDTCHIGSRFIKGLGIPEGASIELLAYVGESTAEPLFIFVVHPTRRYYFYDGGSERHWRFKGRYKDHDDFFRRNVNKPNFPIC